MSPETIFRIASMTKPITSTAVMILAEQGRIDLSDPVSRYLPEFKFMQVAMPKPKKDAKQTSGDSSEEYELVPAYRPITIRDLLTHTSGLCYRFRNHPLVGRLYARDGICDGLSSLRSLTGRKRATARPSAARPSAGDGLGVRPLHRCLGPIDRGRFGQVAGCVFRRANLHAARDERHAFRSSRVEARAAGRTLQARRGRDDLSDRRRADRRRRPDLRGEPALPGDQRILFGWGGAGLDRRGLRPVLADAPEPRGAGRNPDPAARDGAGHDPRPDGGFAALDSGAWISIRLWLRHQDSGQRGHQEGPGRHLWLGWNLLHRSSGSIPSTS